MHSKMPGTPAPSATTCALWDGQPQTSQRFGASLHTLWRFLKRGHLGRSLSRAVVAENIGDDDGTISTAARYMTASRQTQATGGELGGHDVVPVRCVVMTVAP